MILLSHTFNLSSSVSKFASHLMIDLGSNSQPGCIVATFRDLLDLYDIDIYCHPPYMYTLLQSDCFELLVVYQLLLGRCSFDCTRATTGRVGTTGGGGGG